MPRGIIYICSLIVYICLIDIDTDNFIFFSQLNFFTIIKCGNLINRLYSTIPSMVTGNNIRKHLFEIKLLIS